MMLEEFITENFIEPLCRYYTPIGTVTYGLILVLAVLGTYKLLKKLKIKIDKRFFLALLPFIIYGGWTRALRDYGLGFYDQSKLFCSPPIYFFVFFITLASLLLGIFIERKINKKFSYEKIMLIIGIGFLLYNATITQIVNIFAFSFVLFLAGSWSLLFFGIHKLKPKLLSLENAGILSAHLLDASSTFTALTFYGFYEQHVVPNFVINIFGGPWIMFLLKILVVWFVLWVIDRSKEDLFFKRFLKIIILILGLPLGIRDFLTISIL